MFFLGLNWGLRVRRKPTGAVPSPPTALGHLLSASLTTEVSLVGHSRRAVVGTSVRLLREAPLSPVRAAL